MIRLIDKIVSDKVSNAPLIIFRVLFGMLMAVSIIRFAAKGWIAEFYIQPSFHFPYLGFEWLQPFPPTGMYLVFGLMFLASIGIMTGFFYRASSVLFFLSFTYVELLDKTYYLNHYYFISLASFLLIWLPAHKRFSWDVKRKPTIFSQETPAVNVAILRLQVAIVYVFAGGAKLNRDWLINAMPLKIWLPANAGMPVIGPLLTKNWVAYIFSWLGAAFDLTIPFFLLISRTRWIAYATVIIFHLLTWLLFPIGIFPVVMIFSALVFFPSVEQEKWLSWIESILKIGYDHAAQNTFPAPDRLKQILFSVYLIIQLVVPMRYVLYPGNLFWNEEGFRFSWRVMVMEKAGYISFKITDPETHRSMIVDNRQYLTHQQEKMMSTQPDMILQFAHHLKHVFQDKGIKNPEVTADSFVTLNGNTNRRFVYANVDLAKEKLNQAHHKWIIDYEDL